MFQATAAKRPVDGRWHVANIEARHTILEAQHLDESDLFPARQAERLGDLGRCRDKRQIQQAAAGAALAVQNPGLKVRCSFNRHFLEDVADGK